MIRKNDLRLNFLVFSIISSLGFLPIQFDRRTGLVEVEVIFDQGSNSKIENGRQRSRRRRRSYRGWLWLFGLLNGTVYIFYLIVRLIQSTIMGQVVKFHHLALHVTATSLLCSQIVWCVQLFIRYPKINETIFNELKICDHENRVRRKDYTIQEWMILAMPVNLLFGCTMNYVTLYKEDRSSLQFLFSSLPTHLQTDGVFPFLLMYEASMFFLFISTCYYGMFVQLIFIQQCNQDLESRIQKIKSGNWINMKSFCAYGRKTQLKISLFNQVYALIIFVYKLNLIITATAFWYFGIKYLDNLFLSHNYFFVAIFSTVLFMVLYNDAFAIPENMKSFKSECLLAMSKSWPKVTFNDNDGAREIIQRAEKQYAQRKLKSIKNLGIKVGSFHLLERLSTPTFVGFIFSQVCSLLITFP